MGPVEGLGRAVAAAGDDGGPDQVVGGREEHPADVEENRADAPQMAWRSSSRRAITMRWISLVPSPIIMSGASR